MPRIPGTHVGRGPDGAEIFRPITIVAIEIGGLVLRVPALVDSGADNTLVPEPFVAPLGSTSAPASSLLVDTSAFSRLADDDAPAERLRRLTDGLFLF